MRPESCGRAAVGNARYNRDWGCCFGWKTPNQGFTPIELLVVILIVAFLVALVLWSSGDSQLRRLRAQRVQCLANLKLLAAAQSFYAEDNYGLFCPSYLDYASLELKKVWMGALAGYHGRSNGVWLCPSATNPPSRSYRGNAEAPWTYTDPISGTATRGSYAINGYLGLGRNYDQAKDVTFKVTNVFHWASAVQKPAQTPVFNDAVYWNCVLEETASPSRNLYEPQGILVASGGFKRVLTQFIARHGDFPACEAPREVTSEFLPGAINIAFVDGHAATVPLEDLWTLYWHKNWNLRMVPLPHPSPK